MMHLSTYAVLYYVSRCLVNITDRQRRHRGRGSGRRGEGKLYRDLFPVHPLGCTTAARNRLEEEPKVNQVPAVASLGSMTFWILAKSTDAKSVLQPSQLLCTIQP